MVLLYLMLFFVFIGMVCDLHRSTSIGLLVMIKSFTDDIPFLFWVQLKHPFPGAIRIAYCTGMVTPHHSLEWLANQTTRNGYCTLQLLVSPTKSCMVNVTFLMYIPATVKCKVDGMVEGFFYDITWHVPSLMSPFLLKGASGKRRLDLFFFW